MYEFFIGEIQSSGRFSFNICISCLEIGGGRISCLDQGYFDSWSLKMPADFLGNIFIIILPITFVGEKHWFKLGMYVFFSSVTVIVYSVHILVRL